MVNIAMFHCFCLLFIQHPNFSGIGVVVAPMEMICEITFEMEYIIRVAETQMRANGWDSVQSHYRGPCLIGFW